MVIGNATGCSSIWGGSAPSVPYCVNKDGFGPTWGNSLLKIPRNLPTACSWDIHQRSKLADLAGEALEL
jgi:pyruvate-ferredoxin/flavodoxin oxidoreductase